MRNRLFNLFSGNARKGSVKAEGNTIWLYDFIVSSEEEANWFGGVSAEGFAKMLAGMTGPVTVRVNSPGGDVFGGRAMATAMRAYEGQITVLIDGLAASAASIVAVAGDEVIAAAGSMVMIHRAWTMTVGNKSDHQATASLLDKIDISIATSYAARAGEGETDWLALMDAETWLSADEALALGLINSIAPEQAAKPGNSVAWDLSAFANAPAVVVPDDTGTDVEIIAPVDEQVIADGENEIAARQRELAVALL